MALSQRVLLPVAVQAPVRAQRRAAGSARQLARAAPAALRDQPAQPENIASPSLLARLGSGVAALALAAALSAPAAPPALASELDVLTTPTPTVGYVLDDGQLLSQAATGELQRLAKEVEESSGQRITVVTLRKLQFTTDVFEFADKVIEHWYPSAALGDKKGVLLLVKASKEGALVGGPSLSKALGGALLDSISSDNIAVYSEQEKFGEALTSSLKRVAAKLAGSPDPGPPSVEVRKTGSNFKTKEETEDKKGIYGLVVGGLLVISFIVPMVQYFGYVSKGDDEPVAVAPARKGAAGRKK